MMSDFDKECLVDILHYKERHYDWFTAHLLRAIWYAPEDVRAKFATEWPEEVERVSAVADPEEPESHERFEERLKYLVQKADMQNQWKLAHALGG